MFRISDIASLGLYSLFRRIPGQQVWNPAGRYDNLLRWCPATPTQLNGGVFVCLNLGTIFNFINNY